jgi:hypothetical protein
MQRLLVATSVITSKDAIVVDHSRYTSMDMMRAFASFGLLAASLAVLIYSENIFLCLLLVGLALALIFTAR